MTDHDSPVRAWALVALAVLGVSLSAPVAAATAAPALAVAFWRTALGGLVTVPFAWRHPARAPLAGPLLAGLLLAVHFGTWITSLRLTSVTASTALVTTAPLWIVLIERLRGVRVPVQVVTGVLVACLGVLAITGVDAGRSPRALAGDLLALAGAASGGAYMMVGEAVRRGASTAVYTTRTYLSCALLLLPVCVVFGVPLGGWDARTWSELAVLTLSAQLLGHTALNAAVATVGATPLSLALLLEVPGAALVAWAWLGQQPPAAALPGVVAVLAGLALVLRSRGTNHAGAS